MKTVKQLWWSCTGRLPTAVVTGHLACRMRPPRKQRAPGGQSWCRDVGLSGHAHLMFVLPRPVPGPAGSSPPPPAGDRPQHRLKCVSPVGTPIHPRSGGLGAISIGAHPERFR